MGYTHYAYRDEKLDLKAFTSAVADCKKVVEASGVPVAFEFNDTGKKPVFTKDLLRFNGLNDDGHETFYIPRVFKRDYPSQEPSNEGDTKGMWFSFCKTAYKPYDLPVTACLIILKHHLGKAIAIRSDGDDPDWDAARQLVQNTLGYGSEYHMFHTEKNGGLQKVTINYETN